MGLKVAVACALGRMGRVVCATIAQQSDLELVGGFDLTYVGEPLAQTLGLPRPCGLLYDDVSALYAGAQPDSSSISPSIRRPSTWRARPFSTACRP